MGLLMQAKQMIREALHNPWVNTVVPMLYIGLTWQNWRHVVQFSMGPFGILQMTSRERNNVGMRRLKVWSRQVVVYSKWSNVP